jgi:hypothetical protein
MGCLIDEALKEKDSIQEQIKRTNDAEEVGRLNQQMQVGPSFPLSLPPSLPPSLL